MADALYLDSSAIVKTIVREPESAALRRFLKRYPVHASSALARAEVMRAVRRVAPEAVRRVHEAMGHLVLVGVSDSLLHTAGALDPPELRTLDAVHLVSALGLGPDLAALVTYDERMAEGARRLGVSVESPS